MRHRSESNPAFSRVQSFTISTNTGGRGKLLEERHAAWLRHVYRGESVHTCPSKLGPFLQPPFKYKMASPINAEKITIPFYVWLLWGQLRLPLSRANVEGADWGDRPFGAHLSHIWGWELLGSWSKSWNVHQTNTLHRPLSLRMLCMLWPQKCFQDKGVSLKQTFPSLTCSLLLTNKAGRNGVHTWVCGPRAACKAGCVRRMQQCPTEMRQGHFLGPASLVCPCFSPLHLPQALRRHKGLWQSLQQVPHAWLDPKGLPERQPKLYGAGKALSPGWSCPAGFIFKKCTEVLKQETI